MAESIFPTLRMALNQALGGIRLGFGRLTAPARQEHTEEAVFLARLEQVLGIELQEAEPDFLLEELLPDFLPEEAEWDFPPQEAQQAPPPQEATPEPMVACAQALEPVPFAKPAVVPPQVAVSVPPPQEAMPEPVVASAQAPEPVLISEPPVVLDPVIQTATVPKPKRKTSTKRSSKKAPPQTPEDEMAAEGTAAATKPTAVKKRTARSASLPKSGKTTKAAAVEEPAPAPVLNFRMAVQPASEGLNSAEDSPRHVRPRRHALGA